MAHNLAKGLNGKTALVLAENPAWHGLGLVAPGAFAVDLAMEHIGYEVEMRKLTVDGAGDWKDQYAPVRTDTNEILGTRSLSKGYRVIQNKDFLDLIDRVFGEAGAHYESVGALGKGERAWALARMPESFEVAQGDEVVPYLLASNAHDGTGRLTIRPTTVRVVCQNTLTLAMHRTATWSVDIGHTGDVKAKLEMAGDLLAAAGKEFANFREAAAQMTRRKMTDEEIARYVAARLAGRGEKGVERGTEEILEILHSATCTVGGAGGTAWAAYNAVSEWIDHHGRERSRDAAWLSGTTGAKAAAKDSAFRAALALAV